jgi:hypothetical protein
MVRRSTFAGASPALALVLALLTPAAALACPACATRTGGGLGQSIALGLFLLLPFVAAGVVFWLIRSDGTRARLREASVPGVPSVQGHGMRSEAQ